MKNGNITPLHGETTIVDEDQLNRLAPYRWYLCGGYAYARIDGRPVAMHVFLMNTPKGMHTDHINRNKLDNRCKNLRVVEPAVNLRNRRTFKGAENPFHAKTHTMQLGVSRGAPIDQVRDAYRGLVKQYHPDTGGDNEMFLRIQKAWEEAQKDK